MTSLLAAVAAALAMLMTAATAGTFFGFSVGVMPGLGAVPASSAVDVMNAINARIQGLLLRAPAPYGERSLTAGDTGGLSVRTLS
ncbi:hypothetical protein GCM10010116_22980 [Microbispora rosea subsp. aerata]|nr:hypothetical protein GCM10010116_22980 [Microbispora rosea subsp. aerata]GIH55773.1 hypothetical protein Mro02_26870 [Microbispora rosea subsp. aerata]GLJ85929.1 hypothetical protein GCM10017588_46620 [Microbispora rosea subsp. aerata]